MLEVLEEWIAERLVAFQADFGRAAEAVACAPGRVNLIGEHTDYTGGLVLPCAIDRHTLVLAAPRRDGLVRVHADDLGEWGEFDVVAPRRRGDWLDYVQAVVFALAEQGRRPGGVDLSIASRVPIGSGLSSSAALGLAVIGALDTLEGWQLDAGARARLVHRGESEFVGVGCGILDQFASALGRSGHALLIDCRSKDVRPVPFAGGGLSLLLVHSGVERKLAEAAYTDRVAECEAAIEGARRAGVASAQAVSLRDLGPDDLPALERALGPLLLRRARHVISENARVDAFCLAMEAGDRRAMGRLLAEGQASLRVDYEVSIPELDLLCALGDEVPGVIGSRLTGAGFGGCSLHLVEEAALEAAAEQLASGFADQMGRRPETLAVRTADGAWARRVP